MADPSLLKYNSLAIALILGLHRFCRCKFCLLPLRELKDMEEREEKENFWAEAEGFLSEIKLLGAATETIVDRVLKVEPIYCLTKSKAYQLSKNFNHIITEGTRVWNRKMVLSGKTSNNTVTFTMGENKKDKAKKAFIKSWRKQRISNTLMTQGLTRRVANMEME